MRPLVGVRGAVVVRTLPLFLRPHVAPQTIAGCQQPTERDVKCPSCDASLPTDSGGLERRCLDCGSLVSPAAELPSQTTTPPSRHSYATPLGKWIAQVQPQGGWGAAYEFADRELPVDPWRQLVNNIRDSYGRLDCPQTAMFVSFEERQRRVLWKFGRGERLQPLSRLKLPLSSDEVLTVLKGMIPVLERLHAVQLAAFDLHPATIFIDERLQAVNLLPSLWLASQARRAPEALKKMPFAAPELAQADRYPNPATADIYALGALARFLLTGSFRASPAQGLPSSDSGLLERWDTLLDGCCRSNPARRFQTMTDMQIALAAVRSNRHPVAGDSSHSSLVIPSPASSSRGNTTQTIRRRTVLKGVVAAVVLGGVSYILAHRPWKIWPSLGSYRRGYADTIIRYANRTYDQARWQKLEETAAIGDAARIAAAGDASLLHRISGWDDDNFVVTRQSGTIVQYRDGHWSLLARIEDADDPVPRMLDADNVLIAGDDTAKHLFQASAHGVVDLGEIGRSGNHAQLEITPIASDLIYAYSSEGQNGILKVADGRGTQLSWETKEAFVHTAENVPLKEYPVALVRYTAVWEAGAAYGIAHQPYWSDNSKRKVVRYQNGIWYAVDDLPEKYIQLHDAWISGTNESPFVVLVGEDGYVLVSNIGAGKLEQSVPAAQEITSRTLIKVWGADSRKYWVMDENGTVWERNDAESRVVVRGLRKDDVTFLDAWVSPTGTVFAITEQHVYRLT